MKKTYIAPVFAFMAFTHEIAFKKKCNFALRSDDCIDLENK